MVVAEGGSGEALLAAYVVVAPGFDGGVAGGGWRVDEWRSVWEQSYGEAVGVDPWFDTRGWVSSFTGEPIAASLMREWVGATVERIAGLGGRSVLEVGLGSGLLVGRLAGGVDRYVATDFSAAAVDRLAGLVADAGWEWVSVARLAGDEVSGEVVGSGFDVVVVNSVAQYFPDRAYAVGVFDRAVSVAGTGGRVFVGDVRDLRLHQAFGLAVELARGPAVSATELAVRVAERTGADAELLFDPAVFFDVAAVSHVQVLPKRGRGPSEMTRFRYDVVLHTADVAPVEPPRWVGWAGPDWLAGELDAAHRDGRDVFVHDIPNARVAAELAAVAAMTTGQLTMVSTPADAADPEDLWDLADRYGYHLELSALAAPGHVHAAFTHHDTLTVFPPHTPPAADTNNPAAAHHRTQLRTQLTRDLTTHTRQRLPDYMVPTTIRILDTLPLTPTGKLDRRGLPQPVGLSGDPDAYVEPRTETERALVALWSELLGVTTVGVEDDFFRLGGHSLLAVRLIASVARELDVIVPLQVLFSQPTVSALATEIDRRRGGDGYSQIPLVDRSVRRRRLDSLDSGSALQAAIAGEPCSQHIDPDLADNGDATWVTVFPLSSAQERMWFLDQIDSGNPTYTVRRAYRVVGDLDPDALQRALDRLVERHDSLRTRVLARDGTLAVAVEDTGEWPLRVVDVSTYSDPVGQVQRLARDDAVQVFDLERGPLAVATAYRLGDRDWVLIVRLHHVVVDGWSLDVLFDELSLAYPSPTSGGGTELGATGPVLLRFRRLAARGPRPGNAATTAGLLARDSRGHPRLVGRTDRPSASSGAVERGATSQCSARLPTHRFDQDPGPAVRHHPFRRLVRRVHGCVVAALRARRHCPWNGRRGPPHAGRATVGRVVRQHVAATRRRGRQPCVRGTGAQVRARRRGGPGQPGSAVRAAGRGAPSRTRHRPQPVVPGDDQLAATGAVRGPPR